MPIVLDVVRRGRGSRQEDGGGNDINFPLNMLLDHVNTFLQINKVVNKL